MGGLNACARNSRHKHKTQTSAAKDKFSLLPALTLTSPRFLQPSCWPARILARTLSWANSHVRQPSHVGQLGPALTSANTLTLANLHLGPTLKPLARPHFRQPIGQPSLGAAFTLAIPHFVCFVFSCCVFCQNAMSHHLSLCSLPISPRLS